MEGVKGRGGGGGRVMIRRHDIFREAAWGGAWVRMVSSCSLGSKKGLLRSDRFPAAGVVARDRGAAKTSREANARRRCGRPLR